jgi:hypothetical protein
MTQKEMSPARARRRAVVRIIQKIQHAVPGVVLLQHGAHAFMDGAEGWHLALGIAEILTASAVFISLLLAMRKLASHIRAGEIPHLHTGIDWTDVFLGLMLYTEVAAKYPVYHKVWSPTFLLGTVMIALGFWTEHIVNFKKRLRGAPIR